MIGTIISWLASFIISIISSAGYAGIFLLTALESACIPIPSEIIMPFSGFLVSTGRFIFWFVIFWSVLGELAGASIAYLIGFYGGKPLVKKFGKYILLSDRDLENAESWFSKYGQATVFFGRLLPVVRTFISLPAGFSRMDFKKFCFYTILGSFSWLLILTYFGVIAGQNWITLRAYFEKFDIIIAVVAALGIIWWIRRHIRHVQGEN